jgi:hypothetical protein
MQNGDVYITIGLDKSGGIVEVIVNGESLRARETPPGPLKRGGRAPGCEEVIDTLVHELLTCRKKGKDPIPPPTSDPTDPCCIRDPRTGRVWCWC